MIITLSEVAENNDGYEIVYVLHVDITKIKNLG